MKKITLFIAAFLMSSVAFGQVKWANFENSLDSDARLEVEASFEKDSSLCSSVAANVDVYVTGVQLLDGTGGDHAIYQVNMRGPSLYATVEVSIHDRKARVIQCNQTDF